MKDVIDMLERMGSDAGLRDSRQELEQALHAEQIDHTVREAMLSGDCAKFRSLMGARPQFSIIMPGVEEEAGITSF